MTPVTIEALERQLAQWRAVCEAQKADLAELRETIRTCDELSRLARIKRDEQSELIEKLVGYVSRCAKENSYHYDRIECKREALDAYEQWKGQK